jgi:rhamnose transport system permease protein
LGSDPRVLAGALALEVLLFVFTGKNFLTWANFFEIVRLSVELGLLALALTPVIITGGIDLSVGSMMGLGAVVFGILTHDHNVSVLAAAVITLVMGAAGGALNALPITSLRLPALIVTLGTYSLFRGLAQGLTGGVASYTNFSPGFLFLGQGYLWHIIPPQSFVLLGAIAGYWLLIHRTIIGRALFTIGYSYEATRYAGVPVARRLRLVYVLSGLVSSAAAILYVAHTGQAKADAGTGYELMAITAVVLGGTSIFGGRGTVLGTVLGLFVIVVLQNGLRLSDLPAELTGILTGVLLLATISIDHFRNHFRDHFRAKAGAKVQVNSRADQTFTMKNSQVAVLSVVILAAAGIIASSNRALVSAIRERPGTGSATHRPVVAMMPKAKGDPYFVSCRAGAEEAARELGVELIWDGPTDLDPAKQNEVVEGWITRGVDAIAVSVENREAISTVLRKARSKGIRVITWDADAEPDARDFFIDQATPQGIGYTLMDRAAEILGGKGEFVIVTASLSAANQNEWIKYIKERLAAKYKDIKLDAIRPSEGDRDRAFAETQTVLKVYPHAKVIMGIAAPAVPGVAEAVQQSGRRDVKVTGLSLPNMCKSYVDTGVIDSIVLWNTRNLGFLTVYAANALASGKLKQGDTSITAGRLGRIEVRGSEVMLGAPFVFNKSNIHQFDF